MTTETTPAVAELLHRLKDAEACVAMLRAEVEGAAKALEEIAAPHGGTGLAEKIDGVVLGLNAVLGESGGPAVEPQAGFVLDADDASFGALLLLTQCHGLAKSAGWWVNLKTGQDLSGKYVPGQPWAGRNIGELLMLVCSEAAEGMEGARKGLMDDKLPHVSMLEAELADVVIRVFDLAGGLGMENFPLTLGAKLSFNASRADHKVENRAQAGGKSF